VAGTRRMAGMNQERMFEVLRSQHLSEKSNIVGERDNQVVFHVASDATKAEIRAAVATLFDVKVVNVTTLNVKAKVKRFRGQPGSRKGWKKAYVTLADGEDIDFLDGAAVQQG